MLSDMINPDLYFTKKSINLNPDPFAKQVIVLLVLNFIYWFSKEIFIIFIVNVFAVLLLAKLNEIITIKKNNIDLPSLKIVIVNKGESCFSSPNVNVSLSPTEDCSNYDIKIEQDDALLKESYISNDGLHVNGIDDSHLQNKLGTKSQIHVNNMVDICTQTPVTIDSTVQSATSSDQTTLQSKNSNKIIYANSNSKCSEFSKRVCQIDVDTSKISIHEVNSQNGTESKCKSVSKDTFPSFHSSLNDILSVLPKFHGNSKRFLRFKHRFQTILKQFDLNFEQKGLILFLSLDEKVAESLGIVCVDRGLDYDELWRQLESEYFGPQHGPLYHGGLT